MSRYSLKLIPFALAVLATLPAKAQQKIAFVDTVAVLTESAEGKAKIEQWNQLVTAKQAEIQAESEALNKLRTQFAQQQITLNPETRSEMQRQIEEKATRVKRLTEDSGRDAERRRNEILKAMNDKIRVILDEYGKANGYAAIFLRDPTQQIFVADALDITQEILQIYNQKNPVAAGGR